jgi:hypothetical protein
MNNLIKDDINEALFKLNYLKGLIHAAWLLTPDDEMFNLLETVLESITNIINKMNDLTTS